MIKKLVWMAIMASYVMSVGYCCDMKLLRIESDSCLSKISAGFVVPKEIIRKKLSFLPEAAVSKVDKKYTQDNLSDFYQETLKGKKEDQKLHQFAQSCKELFDAENTNTRIRIAVLMLLEKVSEKYLQTLDLVARSEAFKKKEQQFQVQEPSDFLQRIKLLLNADKEIGTKQ